MTPKQRVPKIERAWDQMTRAKRKMVETDELATAAIVEAARAAMTETPIASEYIQAMGTWYFFVIVPYADKEMGFYESDIHDAETINDVAGELDPEYAAHVQAFTRLVEEVAKLHDEYQEIFGRPAGSNPMRFKATGPIITDW